MDPTCGKDALALLDLLLVPRPASSPTSPHPTSAPISTYLTYLSHTPCCTQGTFAFAWPHSSTQEDVDIKVVPTLEVMALHKHGMPTTVLAGECSDRENPSDNPPSGIPRITPQISPQITLSC